MRNYNDEKQRTLTIIGCSGNEDIIIEMTEYFEVNGLQVLAPKNPTIKSNKAEDSVSKTDESVDIVTQERDFLEKCIDSDFVYVCNIDGTISKMVMLELGYMLGKRTRSLLL